MTTKTTTTTATAWNRSTWYTRAYGWRSMMDAQINGTNVQIRIDYAFYTKRISDVTVIANGIETAFPVAYGKGAAAISAAKAWAVANIGGAA